MKSLALVLSFICFNAVAQTSDKVIYGNDDREDIVNVVDNMLVEKSRSVAGMFGTNSLSVLANGDYKVVGQTLQQRGWCSSERFSNQITSSKCTGFLIGSDILVTAGHCITKSGDCRNNLWAFDYKLPDANATTTIIPKNSVYKCSSIISRVQSSTTKDDYAVIRLNRRVTDRQPLEYRRTGKIADGNSIVMIGMPKGLPMKIAGGANVRSNTQTKYFVANTDSYAGNSGSPIFDALTGVVEGILVRGESDSVTTSAGCNVSRICSNTGCAGEDITRITNIPAL